MVDSNGPAFGRLIDEAIEFGYLDSRIIIENRLVNHAATEQDILNELLPGCEVNIHNLTGRPEWNGRLGRVMSAARGARFGVLVEGSTEPVALRALNLTLSPLGGTRLARRANKRLFAAQQRAGEATGRGEVPPSEEEIARASASRLKSVLRDWAFVDARIALACCRRCEPKQDPYRPTDTTTARTTKAA